LDSRNNHDLTSGYSTIAFLVLHERLGEFEQEYVRSIKQYLIQSLIPNSLSQLFLCIHVSVEQKGKGISTMIPSSSESVLLAMLLERAL
jgi:hypothetical protein